jgi:hypothetical protein
MTLQISRLFDNFYAEISLLSVNFPNENKAFDMYFSYPLDRFSKITFKNYANIINQRISS